MASSPQDKAHELVNQFLLQCDSEGIAISEQQLLEQHPALRNELQAEFRRVRLISKAMASVPDTSDDVAMLDASLIPVDDATLAADVPGSPSSPPQTVRCKCPYCKRPAAAELEGSFRAVACKHCGETFSLIRDRDWPRKIANFELIERIGLGGYGSVWKAYDTNLERHVALKLPRRVFLDPSEGDAFLREARTAANLDHPNIVKVNFVGVEDDLIYIASELIEGEPLSDHIGEGGVSTLETVSIAKAIANALHYAHEEGVVHRDLKPSNVIMRLDGKPFLSDFGLARKGSTDLTVTVTGQILGTPGYMSPEQARGEGHSADRRSDVYSLGVLLYELLTGEVPFRGAPEVVLTRVRTEEPANPRRLNRRISLDLDTICMKCLEKDPNLRYQSAKEVADELGRFANNKPIVARPISTPARLFRWAKRNPAIAMLASGMFFAIIASCVLTSYLVSQSRIVRQREASTIRAELQTDFVTGKELGYGAAFIEGIGTITKRFPELMKDPAFEASLRIDALQIMGDMFSAAPVSWSNPFGSEKDASKKTLVAAAATCFDGSRVAVGFRNGRLHLYDSADPSQAIAEIELPKTPVLAVQFRQRSNHELVMISEDGVLYAIDFLANDEKVLQKVSLLPSDFRAVEADAENPLKPVVQPDDRRDLIRARFSHDGSFVVFSDRYNRLSLWDARGEFQVVAGPKHFPASQIKSLAVAPDGSGIAFGSSIQTNNSGAIHHWNVEAGEFVDTGRSISVQGTLYRNTIAYSQNGKSLVVGCQQTLVFDALPSGFVQQQRYQENEVCSVALTPDNKFIAIVYITGECRLRSLNDGETLTSFSVNGMDREGVTFSGDGTCMLVWTADGFQAVDLTSAQERTVLAGHAKAIPKLQFNADGTLLVSCGKDGFIRFWDTKTRQQSRSIEIGSMVQCFAYDDQRNLLAIGHWGETDQLSIRTGDFSSEGTVISHQLGSICSVQFSPDGNYFAASGDYGFQIWRLNVTDGEIVVEPLRGGRVRPMDKLAVNESEYAYKSPWLTFDEIGERVFYLRDWESLRYLDIASGKQGELVAEDESKDLLEAWHSLGIATGNRLVFVDTDGHLCAWEVPDKLDDDVSLSERVPMNVELSSSIISVSNDNLVAARQKPRSLVVWDLESDTQRYKFRNERSSIYSTAWSADGKQLAVGLSNGGLAIWHLDRIDHRLESLGFQPRPRRTTRDQEKHLITKLNASEVNTTEAAAETTLAELR